MAPWLTIYRDHSWNFIDDQFKRNKERGKGMRWNERSVPTMHYMNVPQPLWLLHLPGPYCAISGSYMHTPTPPCSSFYTGGNIYWFHRYYSGYKGTGLQIAQYSSCMGLTHYHVEHLEPTGGTWKPLVSSRVHMNTVMWSRSGCCTSSCPTRAHDEQLPHGRIFFWMRFENLVAKSTEN